MKYPETQAVHVTQVPVIDPDNNLIVVAVAVQAPQLLTELQVVPLAEVVPVPPHGIGTPALIV